MMSAVSFGFFSCIQKIKYPCPPSLIQNKQKKFKVFMNKWYILYKRWETWISKKQQMYFYISKRRERERGKKKKPIFFFFLFVELFHSSCLPFWKIPKTEV